MDKISVAITIAHNLGGMAKTMDFVSAGMTSYDVFMLCKEGSIERIQHGFYKLPQNNNINNEKLLGAILPQGGICVESALFHYGYSDKALDKWSVALSRSLTRVAKKMHMVPIKAYFIREELLILGRCTEDFNGTPLAVYDQERTICDCFKYRSKLDNELFSKAVISYSRDKKKNASNLAEYAKVISASESVSMGIDGTFAFIRPCKVKKQQVYTVIYSKSVE